MLRVVLLLAALALVGSHAFVHAAEFTAAPIAGDDATMRGDAARALVARVVPKQALQFAVEIIPAAENGHDVFEVESVGGKVALRGNTGVSVASALNWYLKNIAHSHLSWNGNHINLPRTLAPVPAKVRVVNPHKYREMFGYCTLNYTASWWDKARWERELDFLAMQGVNMPLGVVGVEAVWYDMLLKYGFSDEEARTFLVGPAYFAWQWMTNIEGHGGPLPRSWIESHRTLGKWWMDRARSLGMTPIRQGFSGYVPHALKEKFPQASIAIQPNWVGFPGSAQLDPLDPLFKKLGRTFMEESVRNYGEGNLWAADPFHESSPPRPGDKYLNEVGTTIFSLMRDVDPKAIWVMQSWSIRKPIADSVPKGDLLVLDLAGKRTFWGHDYVKGEIHNFGGRINLHGDLRDILANKFATQAAKDHRDVGMGLFPEGIAQNPVFYEAMFDMMWRDQPVNVDVWLRDYALRRYGISDDNTTKAWKILLDEGPYKSGTSDTEKSSMIAARPALEVKKSGPNAGFFIPYKPEKLVQALDLLLVDADKAGVGDTYRYDLVDITRQVLSNLSQNLQKEVQIAYLNKDRAAFDKATSEFEGLLADVDALLATRSEFLYGKWISDARRWGETPEEKALYEHNAAMLVTLWGPQTPLIEDYAWREWSGLIARYYLPRWKQFHAFLRESVDKGDYRDPKARVFGRETFRANAFYSKLADWETDFINRSNADLPSAPMGDALSTVRALLAKYRARLNAVNNDAYRAALMKRLVVEPPSGEAVVLGRWSAKDIKPAGSIMTLDASQTITSYGEYEVVLKLAPGSASGALEVGPVELLINGEKVEASAGPFKVDAASPVAKVRMNAGENLAMGKYELRVGLKSASGKDAPSGEITVVTVE